MGGSGERSCEQVIQSPDIDLIAETVRRETTRVDSEHQVNDFMTLPDERRNALAGSTSGIGKIRTGVRGTTITSV